MLSKEKGRFKPSLDSQSKRSEPFLITGVQRQYSRDDELVDPRPERLCAI